MTVAVNNESGVKVNERELSELAQFVLAQMKVHPLVELSVMLVDEPTMSHLHQQFMGEPGPTDVLAFPMDELRPVPGDEEMEPGLLGDVVVCPSVAMGQAEAANHSESDELNLLCTHGVLHLLGYDHHTPEDEREMFGLQAGLIAQWQKRTD
ncbi:MAG: rRNA maturation RNase YbeY, partial [Candidatus Nanopelagicales bacterium]